jgi:hypothetical protein
MEKKVIGIGFHKTGTTSLGRALEILGYSNLHGAGNVRNQLGNAEMMRLLYENQLDPILQIAEQAQSMEDNPWFSIYPQMDSYFPGSKFILTIREDEKWLKSALKYFKGESDFRKWIYGHGSPVGNESIFQERYRLHNAQVLAYFKHRPKDLLVVDWEKGAGWPELCKFLGNAIPQQPFPHLNKKKDTSFLSKVKQYVKKTVSPQNIN